MDDDDDDVSGVRDFEIKQSQIDVVRSFISEEEERKRAECLLPSSVMRKFSIKTRSA